jgi:hypothetical protein
VKPKTLSQFFIFKITWDKASFVVSVAATVTVGGEGKNKISSKKS